ncbi:HAD family phosphatase [Thermococcus sp. GR6]|uniref:HAD family hydrolase n=1 Tax=Thermococcus sp. GR6 TaxID=1638256 RepID=UPI00142FFC46|nr:HAD family phosphatase [Thermococcus sp. GR6]NJE41634.1 HAD family hydrolase [Thermococcus sp. GR6]
MKKVAVIDIEGTLTDFEFWREMARITGKREIGELLEKGLSGEVEWLDSLLKRVELIRGIDEGTFLRTREKVNVSPEARELVETLREKGFKVVLISGSFEEVLEPFKRLGDEIIANRAIFEDGKFQGIRLRFRDKGEFLERLRDCFILAMGDGYADAKMFERADVGIAVGRSVPGADLLVKDLKELVDFIKNLKP